MVGQSQWEGKESRPDEWQEHGSRQVSVLMVLTGTYRTQCPNFQTFLAWFHCLHAFSPLFLLSEAGEC